MIYLLLADGFEEVEALTPLDLLRRAGKTVLTVSITSERTVRGAHGISVLADLTADALSAPCDEMLILPGGMPGTKNLDASPVTDRLIGEVLANGGRLAAICAAPLILGKRGLLVGKEATCYPGFEGELAGADLSPSFCVTDGNVTTAAGAGCAMDFAAELITLLCGYDKAEEILYAIRDERTVEEVNSRRGMTRDEWLLAAGVRIALRDGKVTVSALQRQLSVGFGKANALLAEMERLGFISAAEGASHRTPLITREEYLAHFGFLPD